MVDESKALFKPKGLRAYDAQLKQQKTMQAQESNKPSEVAEFFNKIGLDRYKTTFNLSGFNTLDKIVAITDNQLEQMGVLPGHQIKIMKCLKTNYGMQRENNHATGMVKNNFMNTNVSENLDAGVKDSGLEGGNENFAPTEGFVAEETGYGESQSQTNKYEKSYSFLDNDRKVDTEESDCESNRGANDLQVPPKYESEIEGETTRDGYQTKQGSKKNFRTARTSTGTPKDPPKNVNIDINPAQPTCYDNPG
jgi:hypothetical protein